MNQATATDLITSRRNPLVGRCRTLARPGSDASGDMLLDGVHVVDEAIRTGLPIEVVALDIETIENRGLLQPWVERLAGCGATVVRVTSAVMAAMSPSADASGVVAIARRPALRLPGWLEWAPRTVLVASDVQDPGNVGALVRVAHAVGFDGLVATGTTADPWAWKALRGSMGSAFHVPVVVERDTVRVLDALRTHGLRLVATVPRGGQSVDTADLAPPLALLIGGEGAGLTNRMLEMADERVSLAMVDTVESLNVAVAAGILAYEVRRRGSVL